MFVIMQTLLSIAKGRSKRIHSETAKSLESTRESTPEKKMSRKPRSQNWPETEKHRSMLLIDRKLHSHRDGKNSHKYHRGMKNLKLVKEM
jgi:hypothetical protein